MHPTPPAFASICGELVTAQLSPAGNFWRAQIQGERAVFFGKSAAEVFYKARLWIVGDYPQGEAA